MNNKSLFLTFTQLVELIEQKNKQGEGPTEVHQTAAKNGYIYDVEIYWNDLLGTWAHAPAEGSVQFFTTWEDGKQMVYRVVKTNVYQIVGKNSVGVK